MSMKSNVNVWECDWWTPTGGPAGKGMKCSVQAITPEFSSGLPEGWLGLVVNNNEQGDSEYMSICDGHASGLTAFLGGEYVMWGVA